MQQIVVIQWSWGGGFTFQFGARLIGFSHTMVLSHPRHVLKLAVATEIYQHEKFTVAKFIGN